VTPLERAEEYGTASGDATLRIRVLRSLYEGTRHDTGRPLGYLVANVAVALAREDLAGSLRERLRSLLAPEAP